MHETRKSLKRSRALLRLVRDGLARSEWRRLNAELRDIGRALAGHRDQDVRRETIARLAADAGRPLAAALERLQTGEAGSGSDAQVAQVAGTEAMRSAEARLRAVRSELAGLTLALEPRTFAIGLTRTHRAGRKALTTARTAPSDEAFHELRKVVQLHWRQMQLLGARWPDLLKARVARARALAKRLGLEHDFAVLAQWLQSKPAGATPRTGVRLIVAACREAQATLRESALREATRLFAGRPRAFASEAAAYWSTAVATVPGDGNDAAPAGLRESKRKRKVARPRSPAATRHAAASGGQIHPATGEGGGGAAPVRAKRRARARPVPAG